jgi:hypothetical protein
MFGLGIVVHASLLATVSYSAGGLVWMCGRHVAGSTSTMVFTVVMIFGRIEPRGVNGDTR